MKKLIFIATAIVLVIGCNRQQAPQTPGAPASDSLAVKVQQKDSSIMAYIRSINAIQGSIDTLMREAKTLKINHGEAMSDTATIIAEIRTIGRLMVKNNKELTELERKLKASNIANQELVDLGENLSKQLNQKDSEIASMQATLFRTRAFMSNLVQQFNDSVNVINQERAQISIMTVASNTVYYIIGTEKDLKDKGIITDKGGVIGLGRVPTLNGSMNTSGFTSADLNGLHEIQLDGSFDRMVTAHPEQAYKVTHTSPDKIIITDPQDFWSKSKYMVVIIK